MCEGVDKGFAGSKLTYSKTYPPPSGKKKTTVQKIRRNTPRAYMSWVMS
jgi:hypothetical protein